MNKIKYAFVALCAITLLGSCEKDKVTPVQPSGITNIATEARPGSIKIIWTREEPVKYEYVKVTYFDKLEKKEIMRMASQYSDGIIIPNTRAKYGDYKFTLQPFSITDTEGAKHTITGKSGAAPATITVVDSKKIELKPENLFTDAQEPTEGPIKDLIDGKTSTFFHAAWSVDKGPMPHYIVVKLDKPVRGFKFTYITRDNAGAGNHPKEMNIYASKTFDGKTYNVEGLTSVVKLTSGLPNGRAQTFNSADFVLDDEYSYVWFQVQSTHGNTKFFTLAELSLTELEVEVIDPEVPAEGD